MTNPLYFGKLTPMSQVVDTIWKSSNTQKLTEVLASMSNISDIQAFLRDVMTEKEITEVSSRLEAACMLNRGVTYSEIVEKTKLSSRTVARISDWSKNGRGGYAKAINIINAHHSHIPPVCAD